MFKPKPKLRRLPMSMPHRPSKEERALLELIERRVFYIRYRKVILSTHLADLYEIEPRVLIQAVERNRSRFPDSFVFQLNTAEFSVLKSQFVISKYNKIRRSLPYAFSEQGVVMLSGVLRNPRTIAMNIAIVRTFVRPHRLYSKTQSVIPDLW
jgi:hypothetical protein